MKRLLILSACMGVFGVSCAGSKIALTPEDGVKVDKVIQIYGEELVAKKVKYVVKSYVTNLSDKAIIFRLSEILCFRGTEQGILGHASMGIGERVIDFAPGQQKRFSFGCTFGKREPVGPFKIVFTKVYANPNGDRVSFGKVLKENIVWNIHSDDSEARGIHQQNSAPKQETKPGPTPVPAATKT